MINSLISRTGGQASRTASHLPLRQGH